ncbi:putative RDD family membrane protein YckC [Nonlabens dokdonensis]|uniref:RDD family membrane protein YckC n=2 Tax=Nonlabens dokdonensis TaxID=328515 RepID=A0ABX5PTQ3_9FLAO|nr:RDD family protein [Nonlabens dokdonensis]AGC77918.1 putative transmembrane protein [Nonlabens dokdonensis DSW-6]PZX36650.1 putative RDD family membrane protein YckC [Nonlabens dokdonensis]
MSNTAINTAQNVNIEYEYSGIGKRLLAFLLDLVVFFIYILILSFTVYQAVGLFDKDNNFGIAELSFIPIFCYSLFMHIIFNGRTVGKFVMGIKVVKEDGSPAQWSDFLVRWIFRLVDIWLFVGTVGVVGILFSERKQRMGDLGAKTVVINTRKSTKISHTILEELDPDYQPQFQNAYILSDADVNEIKDIYRLAGESRDYMTLRALRIKVESLLSTQSDLRDGVYIRTVLKDYTYLTQGQ